ncbi:unnamed protein product, partial [Bubo scandiacus]
VSSYSTFCLMGCEQSSRMELQFSCLYDYSMSRKELSLNAYPECLSSIRWHLKYKNRLWFKQKGREGKGREGKGREGKGREKERKDLTFFVSHYCQGENVISTMSLVCLIAFCLLKSGILIKIFHNKNMGAFANTNRKGMGMMLFQMAQEWMQP